MSAVQRMSFRIEHTVYILQILTIRISAENLVVNGGVDILGFLKIVEMLIVQKLDEVFISVPVYLIDLYFHSTFLPRSCRRPHRVRRQAHRVQDISVCFLVPIWG